MTEPSKVYLVGAGPGDPDLLTVKAMALIERAEVVVYDRLVSKEILDLIPQGCMRIFVGKASGRHHMPQDEINGLLSGLALKGHTVVRLKGGDPFVFGRGGEEALHLSGRGVPFEVVPGITASNGVGAALGVPLTHRGLATGVRFVTGHCRADADLDLDWKGLADPDTTLVFYMAKANLGQIVKKLTGEGLDASTPALAVSKGTTARQRHCVTTLGDLRHVIEALAFEAPMLIMIGKVVSLAAKLNGQGRIHEEDAFDGTEKKAARA